MRQIKSKRELRKLADKRRLKAVRKRLWEGMDWYGENELQPRFFSDDMSMFYIEVGGARTTTDHRQSKNFVFFVG